MKRWLLSIAVCVAACGKERAIDAAEKQRAVQVLREAIETRYSHRDRLGLDWDRVFAAAAPAIARARTRDELAGALVTLLANARDAHISVIAGARWLPTDTTPRPPNFDRTVIARRVTGLRQDGPCLRTGTIGDVAYVAVDSLANGRCDDLPARFAAGFDVLARARAVIVDVRANEGGNDAYAEAIAAYFAAHTVPYEVVETRDAGTPGGFTPRRVRELAPAPRQFRGPVVALIGPRVVSSAESMVLMLRATGATLIGAPTWGSSANPKRVALLPDLVVTLPSWRAMAPDGTPIEGKGIQPDIAIDVSAGERAVRDPVLEAALATLARR